MDLEEQKRALVNLREELTARVQRTHKHLHGREEPVSADFAEQAIDMANQELVFNLDAEGKDELRRIDAALARMEQGTYGRCGDCGETIDERRMKALPFANQCFDCADSA